MKKRLALVFALILAAPAHAVPIISLHGGGGNWQSQYASTDVELVWLIGSIAVLAAVVAYRTLRRKA